MNCRKCGSRFAAGEELWHGNVVQTKVLICPECGFRKTPISQEEISFWPTADKYKERASRTSGFNCIDKMESEDYLYSIGKDFVNDGGSCSCGGKCSCGGNCGKNKETRSGGCGGSCGGCKH